MVALQLPQRDLGQAGRLPKHSILRRGYLAALLLPLVLWACGRRVFPSISVFAH